MKICTVCQRYYEDSVVSCAENHGFLTEVMAMREILPSEKSLSDAAFSNFTPAPQTSAEEIKDNAKDDNDSLPKPQGFSPEQGDQTLFAARRIFEERENMIPVEREHKTITASQEFEPVHTEEKQVESFPREAIPFVVKVPSESESYFVKNEQNAKEKDPVKTVVTKAEDLPIGDVKMRETRQSTRIPDVSESPRRSSHLFSSRHFPLLVAVGLLALIASVGLGMFLYSQRQKSIDYEQAAVQETPIVSAPESATGINDDAAVNTDTDASGNKPSVPIAIDESASSVSEGELQNQPSETVENQSASENPSAETETGDKESVERSRTGNEQTELNSSLDEWIAATNNRDVERQMNYYAPKVNAYYRTRNPSPESVRAEKNRVFARANAVEIQTDKPEITLSRDGQSATMRFRKKYVVKEGQKSRRGEVIQELQWIKSDGAWKIVSERDVKVINR
jgi:ketosteroid isomerase-like protein